MPQNLASSPQFETGLSVLAVEIAQERALALGRLGRDVEAAMKRLRTVQSTAPERSQLVDSAADAAWKFFVQREICGVFDHHQAIADYEITPEVLARIGAR